jgi:hypothetical protein
MTWLLIASLYVSYTPEITTMRFETEQECINHHQIHKLINILEDNIYSLRNIDADNVLELMKQHKELFLAYLQSS